MEIGNMENLMKSLKEGMQSEEWARFNEIARYNLTDGQVMALVQKANKEPVVSSHSPVEPTFNTFAELEALYLVKKHRAPDWLRPHLDSTFNAFKNAHDSTVKDTQLRRLQYMLDITWSSPPTTFDYQDFTKQLKDELFGMNNVIERIAEVMNAQQYSSDGYRRPILLVGPYGVGKTSLAKAVARVLKYKFQMISLNGITDPENFKGSGAEYCNGDAGWLMKNTRINGTTRQVILFDELGNCVRKKGPHSGGVQEALIDLFGGGWWFDSFLGFPVDFRQSFCFASTNGLEGLPAVLLDRMEIIPFDDYTIDEKKRIAKEYVWRRLKKNFHQEQLDITDEAISEIVDRHADTTGVRQVEKDLENLMRFALREKSTGTPLECVERKHVDLRIPPAIRKKVSSEQRIGTATALAVTDFIGSVLELQVDVQEGPEKLHVTGLPSEDMMDSCHVALRLAAKNTGKSAACDVHIHLDEGGIQKSGPSAGLMIYAAIWSALSKHPLSMSMVSGTGEIDIFGNVKAVGGISAKLLAAERAGCSVCFIPAANQHDVPAVKTLKVIPVKHVDEMTSYILKHCNPMVSKKR